MKYFKGFFLALVVLCLIAHTAKARSSKQKHAKSAGVLKQQALTPDVSQKLLGLYSTKTITTVEGSVDKIETLTCSSPKKMVSPTSGGMHISLKTQKYSTLNVILGPSWFITNQDVSIQPGDELTITGSEITQGKQKYLIAGQVQKKNQVLTLRDQDGTPAWRAWRKMKR